MAFTSYTFPIFVAAATLTYFLFPKRLRWWVLLAFSYLFYWISSRRLILVLFGTTMVTFLFGLWLEENQERLKTPSEELTREAKKVLKDSVKKRGNRILALGILLDLGVLLFLKYFNFFGETANALLGHWRVQIPHLSLLLPLGISFYTLQAIAYLIDINRGKIKADRNLAKFMLFLSFFPQIVQGPIARHNHLAEQLYNGHEFDYRRLCFGAQLILWGFMKKLILADRIATPVAYIFEHYADFHGLEILFGSMLYGVQIYADFSGGMDIARGVAQIFGIELEINFRQPYFSHSIEEFWRRWHITLGAWMRDYVFYPLSLSKGFANLGKKSRRLFGPFVGKRLPAFLSMFVVYLLVGFWHGAEWKYVVYGLWNGVIIMSSLLLPNVFAKIRGGLRIDEDSWSWRGFQVLRTFFLCSLGRFFSRATDLGSALQMFRATFDRWYDVSFLVDGTLTRSGMMNTAYWFVTVTAVLVLFLVDSLHERDVRIRESIAKQNALFRWAIYLLAVLTLAVFGMYGTVEGASSFIYEQF